MKSMLNVCPRCGDYLRNDWEQTCPTCPKHKPGPWSDRYGKDADGFDSASVVEHSSNKLIADVHDEQSARLIAAAPELLEYLKIISEYKAGDTIDQLALNSISAVIAKATGGGK